ncbi:hypothetical protein AYL99_05115 [Fonsecaea erecta]|uniref:Uncharacterized protein n=1 Tax=Fonsecaea erecta TaxID=1367422 RepID=A0A178ZLL2_9EURO|nr:hypothetical protein AYL99_05115 [Fonsecaea erecta]OAP60113.1 hypothetical protein AYL99_05115 [Fonsecaea erecta]
MPPSKTPRRRGPKRRKLREQDSLDLNNCYYTSEDRGFHLDPDIRVGLQTRCDANPYWIPEGETTDPTVVFEEPCPPSEFSAADRSETLSPAMFPEARAAKVVFKRKETQCPPQTDFLTRSALPSPLSVSIHAAAPPRVQFPDCRLEDSMNGRPPDYHSNYLNDIRIPSPLLYHNAQFDYVRPSDAPPLAWSSSFSEYIHGQQKPEPDFTSWRPVEDSVTQDERTDLQRHGSLGFAICTASSSKHRAEASHISDESHDSSTHRFVPSPGDDPRGSPEMGGRNQEYSCAADVGRSPAVALHGHETPWYTDSFMRTSSHDTKINMPRNVKSTGDDLVFPTLPTPVCLQRSLSAYCSPSNTVQPEGNQAANSWERAEEGLSSGPDLIDNTPPSTFDTVEAAMRAVRRDRDALSTHLSSERKDDGGVTDEAQPGAAANVVLPPCMDLVPARLYQHQVIVWPLSNSIIDAKKKRVRDRWGVIHLVDWLEKLNTLDLYADDGQLSLRDLARRPDESNSNFSKEILASEPTLSSSSSVRVHCNNSQSDDESISGRREERLFTGSEHDSEIDLVDDLVSDDEWANWDWDFEPDDVFERIGLFATDWEAAG